MQRAIDEGYTWLRSGYSWYADISVLKTTGDDRSSLDASRSCAVRPAFHLNLSAADSSSARTLSVSDFGVTYDGASKGISSANWYNKDKDIYSNSDKISVTYSDATRTDVGQYTVTLTIKDSSVVWADAKSSADKERTCTMTILQAEPTVNPIIGNGPYYPGSDMPSIMLSSGDTSGSIAWDDGKIAEGKTTYNWTFTSSNSNYKNKTGSATLTLSGIEVNAIEASINLPSGTVIYTSTSLDSLKSYLTVTKKNNNGTSAGTAGQDEYVLEGSLTTGESTIT
ncbi:MAG: hypothetical protein K2I79_02585, partial [Clostridia bacterium]|nr:hypothetical protein [Clostridia bacterium]